MEMSPLSVSRLNLAILSRRFWPLCGPTEAGVVALASALKRAGHNVEVLTVHWEKHWPRNFVFRETEITRIGPTASGPWGAFRFMRNLGRHLNERPLDAVLIYGLREESWAAMVGLTKLSRLSSTPFPILVRIDQHELSYVLRQPLSSRQLSALNGVDQILVDSKWTADWLLNANEIDPALITVISEPIEASPSNGRTSATQATARIALSEAHPVLQIDPNQPLVVCGAPLQGDPGIEDLINAWPRVLDQFPKSRLWILGDGLKGRRVWEKIVDWKLANSIIMTGYFDDLTEIFQAADVCVHPLRANVSCGFLARALTAGVCVVATETGPACDWIEHDRTGMLVPVEDQSALAAAVNVALNNRDLCDRLGQAARLSAQKRFDIDQGLLEFLDVLQRVTDGCEGRKELAGKAKVGNRNQQ